MNGFLRNSIRFDLCFMWSSGYIEPLLKGHNFFCFKYQQVTGELIFIHITIRLQVLLLVEMGGVS
jgi:hypothetical protein